MNENETAVLTPLSRTVFLVGFMGSGKTSVADYLSRALHVEEVDTDRLIEQRTGMPIRETFRLHGEAYFRDLETRALRSLAGDRIRIVSCGGGITLRQENVDLMHAIGVTVWLTAEPETIYARVRNSGSRPLLNGHMNVPYIAKLLSDRLPRYEKAAQVTVPTDGRSIPEVCALLTERVAAFRG